MLKKLLVLLIFVISNTTFAAKLGLVNITSVDVTISSAKININPVSLAQTYTFQLYKINTGRVFELKETKKVSTTSVTFSSLMASSEYSVQVIASAKRHRSSDPSFKEFSTLAAAPPVPVVLSPVTIVSVVPTSNSATVNISAVSLAQNYKFDLYKINAGRVFEFKETKTGPSTSMGFSGLDASSDYSVRVVANAVGFISSEPSYKEFVTQAPPAPSGLPQVTIVSVVSSSNSASVNINAVTSAQSYKFDLYKINTGRVFEFKETKSGSSTSMIFSDLEESSEYTVKVVASAVGFTSSEPSYKEFLTQASSGSNPPAEPTPPPGNSSDVDPVITGRKFYFSNSGNDGYTLTQAQNPATPFKSISKLNSIISSLLPGDGVLFKRGESFYGKIVISSKSGQSLTPIIFASYGEGSRAVITGLSPLPNLVSLGNGIYEATYSGNVTDLNLLSINGVSYPLARYPKANAANDGYLPINSLSGSTITDSEIGKFSNLLNSSVVIRKNSWIIDRHNISAHNGGQSLTFNTSTTENSTYPAGLKQGFFLQNNPQFLTSFGDWSYDKATKKVRVHLGSTSPANAVVAVATDANVLDLKYSSHVQFHNLNFKGSNGDLLNLQGSSDVLFKNNTIEMAGLDGLRGGDVPRLTLEGNLIKNTNNNGVFLSSDTRGFIGRKNTLRNIGVIPGMGRSSDGNNGAIMNSWGITDGAVVEDNDIENVGYVVITFHGNNNIIRRNRIKDFCMIKGDGGAIYSWNGNNTNYSGNKIHNNLISGGLDPKGGKVYSHSEAFGIYMDDNFNGVEIYNNTIFNNSGAGIYLHNTSDISIHDNTISNNASTQMRFSSDSYGSRDMKNMTVSNNFFIAGAKNQMMVELGSSRSPLYGMGAFVGNSYIDYFSSDPLFKRTENFNGVYSEKIATYRMWTSLVNDTLGSENRLSEYRNTAVSEYSSGLITNWGFNTNANGTYVWSVNNDSRVNWVSSSALSSNGHLQLTNVKDNMLAVQINTGIVQGRHYRLRFRSLSSKESVAKVYLRYAGSPYSALTNIEWVRLGQSVRENEIFFKASLNSSSSIVVLEYTDSSFNLLLDDIELHEVSDPSLLFGQVNVISNPSLVDLLVDDLNSVLVLNEKVMEERSSVIISPYQSKVYLQP